MTATKQRRPHHRPVKPAKGATPTAGAVSLSYIRREVDMLVNLDPLVRQGDDKAVHRTRVAARRIRSALSTFGPLFDPAVTAPLRAELQWLGGVLASARESGVLREKLLAHVRALPPELVIGPVAARITSELGQRGAEAVREAGEGLDDQRHVRLIEALSAFLAAPPLTAKADQAAARLSRKRVLGAAARVDRLAVLADDLPEGPYREEALHDVRKAAKRSRYAAEATVGVLGEPARALSEQMALLQELLGDHLDSVPAQQELLEMASRAHLGGENAITYGVILGIERAHAAALIAQYPARLQAAQAAAAQLNS